MLQNRNGIVRIDGGERGLVLFSRHEIDDLLFDFHPVVDNKHCDRAAKRRTVIGVKLHASPPSGGKPSKPYRPSLQDRSGLWRRCCGQWWPTIYQVRVGHPHAHCRNGRSARQKLTSPSSVCVSEGRTGIVVGMAGSVVSVWCHLSAASGSDRTTVAIDWRKRGRACSCASSSLTSRGGLWDHEIQEWRNHRDDERGHELMAVRRYHGRKAASESPTDPRRS